MQLADRCTRRLALDRRTVTDLLELGLLFMERRRVVAGFSGRGRIAGSSSVLVLEESGSLVEGVDRDDRCDRQGENRGYHRRADPSTSKRGEARGFVALLHERFQTFRPCAGNGE